MTGKHETPEPGPHANGDGKQPVERIFRLKPGEDAPEVVVDEAAAGEPEARLEVPTRPSHEMKSIQPGVEAITDVRLPTAPEVETDWGRANAERRPLPWGWFVLLGLLIAGGAFWSLNHVIKADPQLEQIRDETDFLLDSEAESVAEARELIEGIERAVRAFCEASGIDGLLRVSRHPNRVRPLMEDHYARHPLRPLGQVEMLAMRPLTLGQHGGYWMASIGLPDGEKKSLIVEADEGGETRVDWETAVCYQPMDWDEYARSRPEGTLMDFRVYVEKDTLYSHEFVDSEVWDCYKLTALESEEVLFGYVRADSPSGELLNQWFRNFPGRQASMILCLSLPEGLASPRGVVIDHAKSVRWVYLVPPEGE